MKQKSRVGVVGVWAVALVALSGIGSPTAAQVRIGGQGVYQSEVFDGTFGVGGRALIDVGFLLPGLSIMGTYDWYFPDCETCSFWEAGGAAILAGGSALYFGGGASYQKFERDGELAEFGDTEDWIFNILLGLQFPNVPAITPFGEVRFEVGSDRTNQLVFSVGALLGSSAPPRPGRR